MQSQSSSDTLSSTVGKSIYTTDGKYIGEVEDIILDINAGGIGALAVSSLNTDAISAGGNRGVRIPDRYIEGVGDIVTVSPAIVGASPEPDVPSFN